MPSSNACGSWKEFIAFYIVKVAVAWWQGARGENGNDLNSGGLNRGKNGNKGTPKLFACNIWLRLGTSKLMVHVFLCFNEISLQRMVY